MTGWGSSGHREQVVDNTADNLNLSARGAPGDHCVEMILCTQHVGHGCITSENTTAHDGPVGVALCAELVDVGGQVSSVKSTNPNVHNASPQGRPVVVGYDHCGLDGRQ